MFGENFEVLCLYNSVSSALQGRIPAEVGSAWKSGSASTYYQLVIMDTVNLKVEYKSTQLISMLSEHLKGKMNLAHIKFFGLFIIEDTHLRDLDRIEKLLTVVMLAFAWA